MSEKRMADGREWVLTGGVDYKWYLSEGVERIHTSAIDTVVDMYVTGYGDKWRGVLALFDPGPDHQFTVHMDDHSTMEAAAQDLVSWWDEHKGSTFAAILLDFSNKMVESAKVLADPAS